MPARHDATQSLRAFTTRIFRCQGLAEQPDDSERFGWSDLLGWILFGTAVAAWYFMLFQPKRQRNDILRGRQDVLGARIQAERIEWNRLKREAADLENGTVAAWERAARTQLGWVTPGEVVDIRAWRREEIAAGRPDPLPPPEFARRRRQPQHRAPVTVNAPHSRPRDTRERRTSTPRSASRAIVYADR